MCGIRLREERENQYFRVGTVILSELNDEGQTVLLLYILILWIDLGFRYPVYSISVPSTINNLPYKHTIVNMNVSLLLLVIFLQY